MEGIAFAPELLKAAGLPANAANIAPLKGGANNRVFRVDLDDGSRLVLKHYFSHPHDLRPRLKSEYEFLEYAWKCGIREIPKPLAQNPAQNAALYSFVEGDLAEKDHATAEYVGAAAHFISMLNQTREMAKHLGPASESCRSSADWIALLEKRLERLKTAPSVSIQGKQLHGFLSSRLLPAWEECKAALHPFELAAEDWIVSPSDFGLHNTLFCSGKARFIDFEYAGWDDPAKTISDFFLQPRLPIPICYFGPFAQRIASLTGSAEKTLERTKNVFAMSKIKWCCIILNVFSNAGKSRREFAEYPHLYEAQLQLAEKTLTNGPML